MQSFHTISASKTALVLTAFGVCLAIFSGTVPASGTGLLHSRLALNEAWLKAPSASRHNFGQGLRIPQAQDGTLDAVVAVDQAFYFSGTRTGVRQGMHASEIFSGVQSRHSANWYSQLQTSITRGAGLAPLYSVSGNLQTSLSAGWELSLGLRLDMRDAVSPDSISYAGDGFPAGGPGFFPPWNAAQVPANGGVNYRLQLNYRYGTRSNSLGLAYSSGRHPDELVARGLPLDDSRQFSLTGNHWLNQDWALNYGVVSGEMNRRQGLHLGLRYQF